MAAAARRRIVESSLDAVLPCLQATPLAGKRLFLTGGTGFFGFWLLAAVEVLNQRGLGVRVTVLSRDPSAFLEAHPRWRGVPWLSWVSGDVRDFDGPSGEFHLLIHAATGTTVAAQANPLVLFDEIAEGTRHVLDFAARAGVSRALLTSSGAVYGPTPPNLDCVQEDAAWAPLPESASHAYARAKREMESLAGHYWRQHGIEPVIARCFTFAGPGLAMDGHFAVGNFIRDALFADAVRVKGDGTSVRTYLYSADLAVWLLQMLAAGAAGEAYNVGSRRAITTGELALLVCQVLAPGKPVIVENEVSLRQEPRRRYVPCIHKAGEALGLRDWTSLEESIRRTGRYAAAA